MRLVVLIFGWYFFYYYSVLEIKTITTKGRLIGSCCLLNLTQKLHHVVYFDHVVYSFWKNFPKGRLFGHVVYSARESMHAAIHWLIK